MKVAALVERPGLRLVVEFEGPAGLAAELAALVARFEAGGEAVEAPASSPAVEASTSSTSSRGPASSAERSRRWRERRRGRVASVSRDTDQRVALDTPIPPWASERFEALRMTLGEVGVEVRAEWASFVAHVERRRRRSFASEANPAGKFVGSPPFGLVIVVFEARVEL